MKLLRVIEEYQIKDEKHIGRYELDIDTETMLKTLSDLVLNQDDNEDEIFDPYFLNENQIRKLYPFIKGEFNFDFENNIYEFNVL